MTPVDSLDTMIIMGFKDEANATRKYIIENLSFDKDISVQNFEITIRLLGGLLTGYQMTGDKRLLQLAEDLGRRLLPVFESPTGMPYRYVNLKTGKVRDPVSNPAETGTLLIEFGTLSKLTGKPIFYNKAKRALVETYRRRSTIGLVGEWINVETGDWTNPDSHISGAIDSYYEYLFKCWRLFGDRRNGGLLYSRAPRFKNGSCFCAETRLAPETNHAERPSICLAHLGQPPRLCSRNNYHSCAGHRRQLRRFQFHQRLLVAATSLPRS
jgi:hypothetical protein